MDLLIYFPERWPGVIPRHMCRFVQLDFVFNGAWDSSMVWFTSKKSRHKSMWRAKRRKDANFERLRNLNISQRQKSPEMVWKSQEWKRQDLAFIIFIFLFCICFNFILNLSPDLKLFTCSLTKQYSWMEVLHLIWYFEEKKLKKKEKSSKIVRCTVVYTTAFFNSFISVWWDDMDQMKVSIVVITAVSGFDTKTRLMCHFLSFWPSSLACMQL